MTVEHSIAHCLIPTGLLQLGTLWSPRIDTPSFNKILQQAARLYLGLSYRDHVTSALCALHWLLIRKRIRFKLALLMYKACINHLPAYLSPAALLKAAPLSAQHLMESLLFLAHSFSLAGCRFLSTIPPFGIPYHLMSAILSPRLSFALSSRLTSPALPMDSSDFPASVCTSELCKEGYIKLQQYCIVLYILEQCRSQEFLMGDLGLIIMYLAIFNVVIFVTNENGAFLY